MNRAARKNRDEVLARQDAELVNFSRRIGHHGIANFIESVRQYAHMAITEDYAKDLLSRGGYPNPKP